MCVCVCELLQTFVYVADLLRGSRQLVTDSLYGETAELDFGLMLKIHYTTHVSP